MNSYHIKNTGELQKQYTETTTFSSPILSKLI